MGRIVENLWDCQYCGTHGNRGRDYVCPNCGKTRDESVKFYLPGTITYYDKPIEKGPDWFCPYCNSYNKHSAKNCKNCGAEKDGTKNYFEILTEQGRTPDLKKEKINSHKENISPMEVVKAPIMPTVPSPCTYPKVVKKVRHFNIQWSWQRFFAILILLIIIGGIFLAIPRWKTITVDSLEWQREIEIETNTLIEEDDWSVPGDAVEVLYTRREIHHYDHVIDHYQTITETKSRQVLDGYDTYYTYRDLGNGFSEEVEHSTPRYRTEYYTETHEEPVYRDDPVYRTKYYYTVWRYIYDHSETSSGINNEPYWPEYQFVGDQREGARHEKYIVNYIDKKGNPARYNLQDQALWQSMAVGKTYRVKVSLGYIIEIKDEMN